MKRNRKKSLNQLPVYNTFSAYPDKRQALEAVTAAAGEPFAQKIHLHHKGAFWGAYKMSRIFADAVTTRHFMYPDEQVKTLPSSHPDVIVYQQAHWSSAPNTVFINKKSGRRSQVRGKIMRKRKQIFIDRVAQAL